MKSHSIKLIYISTFLASCSTGLNPDFGNHHPAEEFSEPLGKEMLLPTAFASQPRELNLKESQKDKSRCTGFYQ
jgi:hypothetical protein